MLDSRPKPFDILEWLIPAEPTVSGVETNAQIVFMSERVEQLRHAVNVVGNDAMRLQQQFDTYLPETRNRYLEPLANGEDALLIGKAVAEFRLRVALRCNYVLDLK